MPRNETTLDVFIVFVALNGLFWSLCCMTLVASTSFWITGQRLVQLVWAEELPETWILPGAMERKEKKNKNSCATDLRRAKRRDLRSMLSQNTRLLLSPWGQVEDPRGNYGVPRGSNASDEALRFYKMSGVFSLTLLIPLGIKTVPHSHV